MSVTLRDMMAADKLDMALVTSGNDDPRQSGQVVLVEPLVWAGCRSGEAAFRRPVPLALCEDGCSWRQRALDTLDAAGIDRNVAYLSRSYSGQSSALLADLAIAPLPLSFAQGSLRDFGEDAGLPELGTYELKLIRPNGRRNAIHDALESHILDSFRPYAATGT
jgi:DNA-binding transcriptional LysR family regulator